MTTGSRRRRGVLWGVVGMVVLALVVVGGVLAGPSLAAIAGLTSESGRSTIDPTLMSRPPTPPIVDEGVVVGPPAGTHVQATLTPATLQSALAAVPTTGAGTTGYVVVDASSGTTLAQSGATTALIPASTMKLLTALAVTHALDPAQRFDTRVVETTPGTIVLVGGGDPYLSSEPVTTGWPRPASLAELADATVARLKASGRSSVTLGYDDSLFQGPGWTPRWEDVFKVDQTDVSALMVDHGQNQTTKVFSRTPAPDAAAVFAAALTGRGIAVTGPPTPAKGSGTELARVSSLPALTLMRLCLLRSDNVGTEMMARHVAIAQGRPATLEGGWAAVEAHLKASGVWQDGTVISDASGVSRDNRVPPATLAAAARLVATAPEYRVLLDGLPVAGATGTLRDRYTTPPTLPGRGIVRAKTGGLRDVSTLAGFATTRDGQVVVFAFMSNAFTNGDQARAWIDSSTSVIAGCGCR